MAEKQDRSPSNPDHESRSETERSSSTRQRKRSAGDATPGRDDRSETNSRNSNRRGEDRAGARDIDDRQVARGESLMRGDEISDIDQPDSNH